MMLLATLQQESKTGETIRPAYRAQLISPAGQLALMLLFLKLQHDGAAASVGVWPVFDPKFGLV